MESTKTSKKITQQNKDICVLMLDHDGVICLSSEWGTRFKNKKTFDNFNKKAVKVLNEIIDATDCEIVVSSDWRFHGTLEDLQEHYKLHGVKKTPIDTTTISFLEKGIDFSDDFKFHRDYDLEQTRSLEILKWLREHPEVTKWVSVDDLDMSYRPDSGWGLENFVLTPRGKEGIKQSGIKEKIIKLLNG